VRGNPHHAAREAGWRVDRLRKRGRLVRLSAGAPSRVPAANSTGARSSQERSRCPTRGSTVMWSNSRLSGPARRRPLSLIVGPHTYERYHLLLGRAVYGWCPGLAIHFWDEEITRQDNPGAYWFAVAAQGAILLAFLLTGKTWHVR